MEITRRYFTKQLIATTALSVVTSVNGSNVFADDIKPNEKNEITLNFDNDKYTSLKIVGNAIKIDVSGIKKPLIVIRTKEDEVKVFSSACTHRGCEVELPNDGKILCPCHKAIFDLTGNVVKGPAKTPLDTYNAILSKLGIVITI